MQGTEWLRPFQSPSTRQFLIKWDTERLGTDKKTCPTKKSRYLKARPVPCPGNSRSGTQISIVTRERPLIVYLLFSVGFPSPPNNQIEPCQDVGWITLKANAISKSGHSTSFIKYAAYILNVLNSEFRPEY